MVSQSIFCASCNETTLPEATCSHCGRDPRLHGAYCLLEVLGEGSFGMTWRVMRLSDGAIFAAKELLIRRLNDFKTHELFEREVNALRDLNHPGIPRYIDSFSFGEGRQMGLYLVFELIDGETLEEERKHRHYDLESALIATRDLALILAYLHGRTPPMVHRDLKPENVMRRRDGRLCLIDFGSIKDVVRQGDMGGTVVGTFGYMPPEQLMGQTSPGSDLYALGVILLELVTRRPSQDFVDAQNKLNWEEALRTFTEENAEKLRAIFQLLLETDVDKRLSDAHQLVSLIDDMLSGRWRSKPRASEGPPLSFNPVADLLQNLGVFGMNATPTTIEPPPPAPRELSPTFSTWLGNTFSRVVGTFLIVLMLSIGAFVIGIVNKVGGLVQLDVFPLGAKVAFLASLLVPMFIGFLIWIQAGKQRRRFKRVYRTGNSAPALATQPLLL